MDATMRPAVRFARLVRAYQHYRTQLTREEVTTTQSYETAVAVGIIRTVVRDDGILHTDLYKSDRPVQMLCMLTDCVSASSRGEEARVQDAFPHASTSYAPSGGRHGYARQAAWRRLGSVSVHHPDSDSAT